MFYKTTLISQTGEEQLLIIAPDEAKVERWCKSEMSAYGLVDFNIELVSSSSSYQPSEDEPALKIRVVGF